MDIEQFENISLYVCLSGLMLYMVFIMYRLAKDSNGGKWGTITIFVALGMGMVGFVVKEVLTFFLEK